MAHALVEVDVTRPLERLTLPAGSEGVGVLLRDGQRPLGLLLFGLPSGELAAPALERLAVRAGAQDVLDERLRQGLLARHGTGGTAGTRGRSVTVAVCTRNRPDDLERCLDSIAAAVEAFAGTADVLVVDNAPPDDATEQVVRRRQGVRYLREPVAGLDVARNRALARARGEWLVFVDDDVRVDEGWLAGLASAWEEHPDAAAVVGLVLPAELGTEAQLRFERGGGFGRGFVQRRWDGRHGPGGRLHPIGAGVFGAGCDMAFEVAVVRGLGGFDEALDTGPPLPGGGDLDMFFRVLAAGHPLVYEPRMAVFHRHRRGMDELRGQYHSWGTGLAAFLGARWHDPAERPQVLRLAAWWLQYQRRQVVAAARQGDAVGVRMALAELRGGLMGVGGHRRSQQRMTGRRAAVALAAARAGR